MEMRDEAFDDRSAVIILVAIPWRYVAAHHLTGHGDRSRSTPAAPKQAKEQP